MSDSQFLEVDFGSPITGGWCATCQLPSVINWPLLVLTDMGVEQFGFVFRCFEHMEMLEA